MGKHKLGGSAVLGHGQDGDEDDDDTGSGPVDAHFVDEVQVF